jgi:hypothetical protein
MKYLKEYNSFNDILYVFDLDDTLVKTPSFESIAKKYIKESNLPTAYDLLNKSVKEINKNVEDLKYENGRIFIQDSIIEPKGNWVRKNTRLYLTTPKIFSYIDESMPLYNKQEIVDIYNKMDQKAILTARPEGSRDKVEKKLSELNIEYPNNGLIMRPDNLMGAGKWKGEQLVKLSSNYEKIIFYEDNAKYIKDAKKVWNENTTPNKILEIIKIY